LKNWLKNRKKVKGESEYQPFGFHLGYSRAVTRAFEHLNPTLNASPAQITLGLRRVMLAIWASQVGLTLVAALIARFVIAPRDPLGFTQAFLAVSLVLYLLVSAFTRVQMVQTKNLAMAFQASMLLGAVSTVPGVLACVLVALEGVRVGSLLLGLASVGLLGLSLSRVAGLVAQIQPVKAAEPEVFEGFGSSSEFERPDWAAQYGATQDSATQDSATQNGSARTKSETDPSI
jgi:hypothetical protein